MFLAIIGLILVLAALAIGATGFYTNLRNTKGPRERAFVRRNCVFALGVVVLSFALMYYLPSPWRYGVLVLYFLQVPVLTYRAATKRQLIRRMEELESQGHEPMTG